MEQKYMTQCNRSVVSVRPGGTTVYGHDLPDGYTSL